MRDCHVTVEHLLAPRRARMHVLDDPDEIGPTLGNNQFNRRGTLVHKARSLSALVKMRPD